MTSPETQGMHRKIESSDGIVWAQSSQDEALAHSIATHITPLRRFFRSRGVPVDDVDDLVQDCLLVFWCKRDRVQTGKTEAFLRGIAGKLVRNYRRKGFRQQTKCERLKDLMDERYQEARYAQPIGRGESFARIAEAVEMLSPRLRETVRWRYLEGLSTRETAVQMGITEKSVRQTNSRAVVWLRNILRPNKMPGSDKP